MSEPFVGEIRMFAGTFAPRGWALCQGQLLSIPDNDALFSLLGTIYGGDGRTTFGLPDLQGRVPLHQGDGPGLNSKRLGQKGGSENETLIASQLPPHTHQMRASSNISSAAGPESRVPATSTSFDAYINEAPTEILDADVMTAAGGGGSHTNIQPFLCINFIIALVGLYPSRT